MKKILFFHQVGYKGGAGTMLVNVIKALDKEKYHPVVVCPAGDIVPLLEAAGATVEIAPRPLRQIMHISGFSRPAFHPRFLESLLLMRRDRSFWTNYIRSSGADVVHLNALTLAPMSLSARNAGVPVVCSVQETFVRGCLGVRTAWLKRLLSTNMDAVTFISEFDRTSAKCSAPIVDVIPNWVNLSEFDRGRITKADARRKLGLPTESKVVLFMGGVAQIKGTAPLLEAIRKLSDIPNLILLGAGYWSHTDERLSLGQQIRKKVRGLVGSDYGAQVRTLLHDQRIQSVFRCVGMQDDVVTLYAAADVVVFPSTAPHQARPVLEAGAMGKPVVISDFAQTREFVRDGVNGLLAAPGDPVSLSQALGRVLNDPSLLLGLGENNYQVTYHLHNELFNAKKMAAIYDRVVAAHAKG